MSRKVWKFKVEPETDLYLPMDWNVIDVAAQGDEAFVWILLDPDLPKHLERFVAIPTGVPVPDNADHVGSWHMTGRNIVGELVFHLFVLAGPASTTGDSQ